MTKTDYGDILLANVSFGDSANETVKTKENINM